jgi:hypothetical protein
MNLVWITTLPSWVYQKIFYYIVAYTTLLLSKRWKDLTSPLMFGDPTFEDGVTVAQGSSRTGGARCRLRPPLHLANNWSPTQHEVILLLRPGCHTVEWLGLVPQAASSQLTVWLHPSPTPSLLHQTVETTARPQLVLVAMSPWLSESEQAAPLLAGLCNFSFFINERDS